MRNQAHWSKDFCCRSFSCGGLVMMFSKSTSRLGPLARKFSTSAGSCESSGLNNFAKWGGLGAALALGVNSMFADFPEDVETKAASPSQVRQPFYMYVAETFLNCCDHFLFGCGLQGCNGFCCVCRKYLPAQTPSTCSMAVGQKSKPPKRNFWSSLLTQLRLTVAVCLCFLLSLSSSLPLLLGSHFLPCLLPPSPPTPFIRSHTTRPSPPLFFPASIACLLILY